MANVASSYQLVVDSDDVSDVYPMQRADQVCHYLDVKFSDGTGLSNLQPTELTSAFAGAHREAERERQSHHGSDGRHRNGGRANANLVYVESTTTGQFFRAEGDQPKGGKAGGGVRGGANAQEAKSDDSLATELGITKGELVLLRLEKVLMTFYVITNWMAFAAAAYTLMVALTNESAESVANSDYVVEAPFLSKLAFVFGTCSLVGALDSYWQAKMDKDRWRRHSRTTKNELRITVLIYTCNVIATQACSIADSAIANKNGWADAGKKWYADALEEDPGLGTKMQLWSLAIIARFLTASVGWLLSCRSHYRQSIALVREERGRKRIFAELKEVREDNQFMRGRRLDRLAGDKLTKLAEKMRMALDHVERTIELRARMPGESRPSILSNK